VFGASGMALKKSQLYSQLWKSCDELRGPMDPSQYKNYILTLLFVKYVSDKHGNDADALIELPTGASFSDMVSLKGDKEIGDKINKIIAKLAEANDLKGVIDQADFNDDNLLGRGKEMQDRLTKLIAIFENMDFHSNQASGDDLLGDAYEYLMRNFATESGKSKGQFYTPAEVSRILAKVVGIDASVTQDMTVYDPTCGSGSLLLKAAAEAPNGVSLYGQENDNGTWALSKMNMILHGSESAEIWNGNTLTSPNFKNPDGGLKTFDFTVANPPFSHKSWTTGLDPENDEFKRFEYGVPPSKNGDYAFLLHALKSLNSRGKAAIILPLGVLSRGGKDAGIRRTLVDKGFIKGVICLPANLFYGTPIPACIIIIDKEGANQRENVHFINASKGFVKDGNKNRLREQDVHKIVDHFNNRIEEEGYSRIVPVSVIKSESNDYNLNIVRYIDSTDPEDSHDLEAHLSGGIPNYEIDSLEMYWDEFPSLRAQLFTTSSRAEYSEVAIQANQIADIINSNQEVIRYKGAVKTTIDGWKDIHRSVLNNLNGDSNPKSVIESLSENFLSIFDCDPLLNKYDVYQRIMEYWAETMQDDAYMLVTEGWGVCRKFRVTDKGEDAEFTTKVGKKTVKYVGQILPASLIVVHFFCEEQHHLDLANSESDQAAQAKQEFEEEHCGDGGDLSDMVDDKGKVKIGGVQDRVLELKESIMEAFPESSSEYKQAKSITKSKFVTYEWTTGVEDENGDFSELDSLYEWLRLNEAEAAAKKASKAAEIDLMQKVAEQYPKLTQEDYKSLLIEFKWYAAIEHSINNQVNRIIHHLSNRVKLICERYASSLTMLESKVDEYKLKVANHLESMGLNRHDAKHKLLTGQCRLPGYTGEWENFRVADVIEKHFCGPSPTCEERNIQGGVEWGVLKTTAITWDDGWDWKQHKTLPEKFWNQPNKKVQYGDVLVTKAGPRHRVGVVVWVDYVPERIIVSGKMIGLRPIKSMVHPAILVEAISSKETQLFLNQRTAGMAEAQVNFPNSAILEAPIRLPPHEEGIAIAEILLDVDSEISAREELQEKIKAVRMSMKQQLRMSD
jgi:type I restriction enzyme M protein